MLQVHFAAFAESTKNTTSAEKREALSAWGQHVAALEPRPVALAAAA
jgi:hypothetical protein